jgi:hypothetical protein
LTIVDRGLTTTARRSASVVRHGGLRGRVVNHSQQRGRSMTKHLCAALAGAAMLAAAAARPQAAPPPKDTPVLLTFGHTVADRLTSDGGSVSVTGRTADYANGLENVLSSVQSSGNYRFVTRNDARLPASRSMCLDFGTQFESQGLAVPFADAQSRQCVDVLQSVHSYPAGDVALQNLRYGQSVRKLTRFGWSDGGFKYRLGYGTDMDRDGLDDAPAVRVTCVAPQDATKACTQWILAPESDGTAALFRFRLSYDRRGNEVVDESSGEPLGTVVMPFTQTLTKQ